MVDIRKNSAEVIRIDRRVYKDRDYVDIRKWVLSDHEQLAPTRQGVRFA